MSNNGLEEFYNYKNKFIEHILTDERIVKMLDPEGVYENPEDLIYRQVFPLEYVPETVEEGKTFICCEVDIDKPFDKTYLLATIFVWVFTHKSLVRLPEGGVRVDEICSCIAEKLNGNYEYGLGTLDLNSVKRFAPMSDYQGKYMVFYATDFNQLNNPDKFIPAHRKGKYS